ncbi:MAG: energy transducer TonB, partial [Exilibacterium sp.]
VVNKKFKTVDKAPENKAEAPWKQSLKSNESTGISPPDMNSSGMTSIGVKEVDLLGQSFGEQKVSSYSKTMNGISLMPSLTSAIKKKVSSAISTVKNIGKPPAAAEIQPYDSELLRLIYKYKTLPRDAFKHRLEGIARVLVTINRSGEIMDLEFEEKSQYKKLNDQALDAVVRASPFPPVPDYIEGEGYTFSVIMEYKLPY